MFLNDLCYILSTCFFNRVWIIKGLTLEIHKIVADRFTNWKPYKNVGIVLSLVCAFKICCVIIYVETRQTILVYLVRLEW